MLRVSKFIHNKLEINTVYSCVALTPQFISLQDDILAFVGSSFTFSCVATSAATLSYVFSVNNQTLPTTGIAIMYLLLRYIITRMVIRLLPTQ